MAQFPAGYPSELKKYGYPPPFPAGYPPEQYEKYGYPPSATPVQQNHTAVSYQTQQQSTPVASFNDVHVTSTPCMFPWGPGNYTPIAGNVYYSGGNINGSGTQTTGSIKFPAGYPSELKKYGYPPPFPAGYPPEQYEKYGYPPSATPVQQNHTAVSYQTQQQSTPVANLNDVHVTSTPCIFPWGPGNYTPIAGNVYYTGGNVNGSGTQTIGDVKIGNHSSK